MRRKIAVLLVSVFMIGLGGVLLFFELSEFTYNPNLVVPNVEYKTITNSYAVEDVDQIQIDSEAIIVIDENQAGIKVDLSYISNVSNIKGYSFIYTYDCVKIGDATQCDSDQSKKALFVGYRDIEGPLRIKTAVDIFANGLKNKVLINVNSLYRPKTTITINLKNSMFLVR